MFMQCRAFLNWNNNEKVLKNAIFPVTESAIVFCNRRHRIFPYLGVIPVEEKSYITPETHFAVIKQFSHLLNKKCIWSLVRLCHKIKRTSPDWFWSLKFSISLPKTYIRIFKDFYIKSLSSTSIQVSNVVSIFQTQISSFESVIFIIKIDFGIFLCKKT